MRILVIQEQHYTKMPNGEIWVDKQSDIKFWDRYLRVFDDVLVCARMKNSDKLSNKSLRSDRERVSFIGLPEFRGGLGLIKNYFKCQYVLEKALSDVDCIIFRAPSPISLISYRKVKKSRKPFAVELMNNPATCFSSKANRSIFQFLLKLVLTNQTKRMCRAANGVSYVTQRVLQGLYPSKYRLSNAKEGFESSYSTINLPEENYRFIEKEFNNKEFVFVHSGEMVDLRKGQNIFIEIVGTLIEKGYNVKGILIGDGDLRKIFEQQCNSLKIKDRISFVGWKSGFHEVQKELIKGDIFIFPSMGEGLPRSLIEAMASGLLCFGSNVDGIVELLDEDTLVNDFSSEAFIKKIEPFLNNIYKLKEKRKLQYNKSKEYEASILNERRTLFYRNLYEEINNNKK